MNEINGLHVQVLAMPIIDNGCFPRLIVDENSVAECQRVAQTSKCAMQNKTLVESAECSDNIHIYIYYYYIVIIYIYVLYGLPCACSSQIKVVSA